MKHLAAGLFLKPRSFMALFNAYFDTGGTENDQDRTVLITFGVVATVEKWTRFDRRWKAALAREGVAELHMRLFAHSRGEFAAWKGDEERRKHFLATLTSEAKRGLNKAFG